MANIILKKDGIAVNIDHFSKHKYPYLEQYLEILNTEIDQLKTLNNMDVEVNLIEGKLINGLLLDNRLNAKVINRNLDSFNNIYAIAIYYTGINGNFLLEKFKDQKICYIQLQQTLAINMLRIAFHELHHFLDPFIPREWQVILEDGSAFLDYKNTIKAYVRLGLNEYCANLHAFSLCLYLLNEISEKKKLDDSFIETYKEALIKRTPSYLYDLSNKLKEFIGVLKSGEIEKKKIPNPKAELIQFLWSDFFKLIYYFLGGWKAYKNRELDTRLIQKTWDAFITEIINLELYGMSILLNSFKSFLLENYENSNEMVIGVEHLFLEYYLKKLESDFFSLL